MIIYLVTDTKKASGYFSGLVFCGVCLLSLPQNCNPKRPEPKRPYEDLMANLSLLEGKRILAVDDEPDVLEVIKEQLPQCQVTTASNYEAARHHIVNENFDLVILDIMGVNGFALLEECRKRGLFAAMLTAHAVNVDSLNRSIKLGAVSFLPKDELARLPELIAEILEALAEGRTHWQQLFKRLGPFFKERLGVTWEDLEKPRTPPYMY
jgi:CheY-like chemotaxis protein